MITIPIKLNELDLEKIDYLIKVGRYKNRSQAIKTMLQEKLKQELISFEEENDQDEKKRKDALAQMLKLSKLEIQFLTKKTAVELVNEERERM